MIKVECRLSSEMKARVVVMSVLGLFEMKHELSSDARIIMLELSAHMQLLQSSRTPRRGGIWIPKEAVYRIRTHR
jgi:hypothetical protein